MNDEVKNIAVDAVKEMGVKQAIQFISDGVIIIGASILILGIGGHIISGMLPDTRNQQSL